MAFQSRKLCSILAIVLLQTVALYTERTRAQAPGDEHDRCQMDRFAHTYPVGTITLMDTYNYEQLLGRPDPIWLQADYDTNNNPNTFFQTSWQPNSGGICRRSIQSCGFREGEQNNWVFSQHITKTTPPNSNIDIEVCVDITYRVSSCRTRFGCNPVMQVYKYVTDSPISAAAFQDEAITRKFVRVFTRTGSSAVSVHDQFCFVVESGKEGFHLAIRDETSCILLSHMLVYRHQCAAQQIGLVKFPETASAINRTRTVTARCVENAQRVSSLQVGCRDNGRWAESRAECRCRPGYREVRDGDEARCEACPAGTYRSFSDPVDSCISCPSNTAASGRAATECVCLTGYYRNTDGLSDNCPRGQSPEGPRVKCTAPPGSPSNLRVSTSPTDSRISLRWSAPPSNGGRSDLYYTVEYSNPEKLGEFLTATSGVCLTNTRHDITGLQPATDYVVRVVAHNGVSDQDTNGIFSRKADITVRTANSPPSAPVDVQGLCNVVVWRRPQRSNGEIQSYDVRFSRGSDPRNVITRRLQDDATHYIIGSNDRPSGSGTIRVQVRAINDAGEGVYSAAVTNVCPPGDNSPPVDNIPTIGTAPIQVSCPIIPACDSCCRCPEVPTCADDNDDNNLETPTVPGTVQNVRALNCTTIVWDPLEDHDGKTFQYRMRIYSGRNYFTSQTTERRVFNTHDSWFIPDWLPSQRPVSVIVKGRNSAGQFSQLWSDPVILTDSATCPCTN